MHVRSGQRVSGHGCLVEPPSFSLDGTRFVAGDRAGRLIVRERPSTDPEAPFTCAAQIQAPPAGRYSKPEVRATIWSPEGSLIATHEYGGIHVRHASDLSDAVPPTGPTGNGPLALGGGGTWLAALTDESVWIYDFPSLENRRLHVFSRGGYEYFYILAIAADPHSSLLVVSDDGGKDETAMAMCLGHGTPQITLFDVARGEQIGVIEQGHFVRRLAFDPWRGRILTVAYQEMGVWLPTGEPVRRFHPYEGVSVRCFAVTERWLVTVPDTPPRAAQLDLWDAQTLQHRTRVPLPPGISGEWIVASPDGRTLLTPEIPEDGDFGIRVWAITG